VTSVAGVDVTASAAIRPSRRILADFALWLACVSPLVPELARAHGSTSSVVVAAIPLLAAAVVVSRRRPLAALGIPVTLSLSLTPELFWLPLTPAVLLLSYLLGRRTDSWRSSAAVFSALCAVGFGFVVVAKWDPRAWITLVVTVLFAIVCPWLLGRCRRSFADLVSTGWTLADRMERERHVIAGQTLLRERSRIAVDMHDSVGHDLSLIALRAASLELAPRLDREHQTAARELRMAAAAATERLREIVGVLREGGEQASTARPAETVGELVSRATDSGLAVDFAGYRDDGPEAPLPPVVERALYRTVQESLTNAAKHAPGAVVRIRLSRYAEGLTVTVTNDPPPAGPPSAGASGRQGLTGLNERVTLAGGTLSAGPWHGGFQVDARFPLHSGTGASAGPYSANTSALELARARRRVRRSMLEAIVLLAGIVGCIALLMTGMRFYMAERSVLDEATYATLRVGQPARAVEQVLPRFETDEAPVTAIPPPTGASCRYYLAGTRSASAAYRLCFTDGSLSAKDVLR
jgi:signal transduction histidine kinase